MSDHSILGSRVGHIRIVSRLARGGMGEVYVGFDEKLERKVALKSIRPEHAPDPAMKARFLQEARLLSQLAHPHICQIYEFVEGPEGEFLVLELIEGQVLKKVVKAGLDDSAKMRIALEIADVLVEAHAAGVVHRDLKPGNVMVTLEGSVKVLDFGLARSVDEEDLTRSLSRPGGGEQGFGSESTATQIFDSPETATRSGQILGTPGYMSPEQANGDSATPASDMYSFGMLLQQLFTGKAPYDSRATPMAVLADVARGRTRPVEGLDDDLTALIERLKSQAPGSRPSAPDAAERLTWIRDKKLRLRKRWAKVAGILLLVAFTAVTSFQSLRIAQEATRANLEAERATQEAIAAAEVSDFLVGLFEVSDPSEALGNSVTARELLDKGAERIDEIPLAPLTRARLLDTIGQVYVQLGLYPAAEGLLLGALEIRDGDASEDSADLATSLHNVADLYWYQGRYAEGEPLYERALHLREQSAGGESLEVADTLLSLGDLYRETGDYEQAEPLYLRALAIREKVLGLDHPEVGTTVTNLAVLYWAQGRYSETAPLLERDLVISEKMLGPDHPDLATSLNNLGALYSRQGLLSKAEPLMVRAFALGERVLGPDHPKLARRSLNLGALHRKQGRFDLAEEELGRALSINENALGEEHPGVAMVLLGQAGLLRDQGRFEEAEQAVDRALRITAATLGEDHARQGEGLYEKGLLRLYQGRSKEAESLLELSVQNRQAALGEENPKVAESLAPLGSVMISQGRFREAEATLLRAVAIWEVKSVTSPAPLAFALVKLAEARKAMGMEEEAAMAAERALGIVEPLLATESSNLGWSETEIRALFLLDREHQARERASFLLENGRIRPGLRPICQSLGLSL